MGGVTERKRKTGMVKYEARRDMLVILCDGCGLKHDLYKGQTDRCLAHDWIKENGWKTMKHHGQWINICPNCKKAYEDAKRALWLKGMVG